MFGVNAVSSGLSLAKILTGISQTLNIANQVIPIYKEAKPLISNAKNIFSVFNEFKNTSATKTIESSDFKVKNTIENKSKTINNESNPVFFQ